MSSSIIDSLLDPNQYYTQFIQLSQSTLESAKTPFQNQITTYQSTISTYNNLKAALANSLKVFNGFTTYASETKLASSTNESAFSAISSSSGVNGSYSVEVTRLATSDTYNKSVPNIGAEIGLGGTITLNGTTITINEKDTYKDVLNKINSSNAKVNAYTLGGNMVITANNTGKANAISFGGDQDLLAALGLETDSPNHLAAEDALLKINGADITSTTNKVSDIIPGVTLTLKKPTTQIETLTVQEQKDTQASAMITNFVNAYNQVLTVMNTYAGDGTSLQASTVDLATDRALNSIFKFTKNGSGIFDFGISVDKTGVLSIDSAKLEAKLAEDPTSAEKFFFGIGGFGDTLSQSFDKIYGATGIVSDETSSLNSEIAKLNTKINSITDRNTTMLDQITQQYTKWLTQMNNLRSSATVMDALIDGMNAGNKN